MINAGDIYKGLEKGFQDGQFWVEYMRRVDARPLSESRGPVTYVQDRAAHTFPELMKYVKEERG